MKLLLLLSHCLISKSSFFHSHLILEKRNSLLLLKEAMSEDMNQKSCSVILLLDVFALHCLFPVSSVPIFREDPLHASR